MGLCAVCAFVLLTFAALSALAQKSASFVVDFSQTKFSPIDRPDVREWVAMTNHLGESFNCSLPLLPDESSGDAKQNQKSIDPDLVLKQFETTCLFRVDGWWTYEFCWKKKLRQFHLEGKAMTMEFSLGQYDEAKSKPSVLTSHSESEGSVSAVIVRTEYVDGDLCDLTNRPRHTSILFDCAKDKVASFSGFRETATCEYAVTISLPQLCLDDHDTSAPHSITCYPLSPQTASQPQSEAAVQAPEPREDTWKEAVAKDASQESANIPEILYSVGTCFLHKKYNYRAVIISADPTCLQTEAWMARLGVNSLKHGPNQPFYHAFVDERDRPNGQVTYVAQEDIEVRPLDGPIQHPLVKDVFAGFAGGHHVARGDVAVSLMPADDAALAALPYHSDVVATVANTLIDDADEDQKDV